MWSCLPPERVLNLDYSWRFGKPQCYFLRETCKGYGEGTSGIHSPCEKHWKFSKAELARVPDTQLRFVAYLYEEFYCSRVRGQMRRVPQTVSTQVPLSGGTEELRIAGSECIFANLIHESLCFLKLILDQQLFMNEQCRALGQPIKLDPSRPAILTIFYGNDVLVNFDATLAGVLSSTDILRAYGLDESFDYLKVWSSGTPESVSGETALLAQVGLMPRVSHSADLRGNTQDEGRRTVSFSRGRLLTSVHSAVECFRGEVPPAWRKHLDFTRAASAATHHLVDLKTHSSRMASVSKVLQPSIHEAAAFKALHDRLTDLPRFVEAEP